jgi:hypothetical protein
METATLWILSVLGSLWIGSFASPYLKKRAENLATHEDLDRLTEQMRITTETTKAIEARITGDLWSSQNRWELTKEIFIDLVRLVGRAEITLKNAVVDFDQRNRGFKAPSLLPHKSGSILDDCIEIAFSLDNHRLMMALVSGPSMLSAYTKLGEAYLATLLCLDISNYHYDEAKEKMKEFGSALLKFQIAAREEMGFPIK